jgi:hypothetical protein
MEKDCIFLAYEDLLVVWILAISDKKAQQTTINRILLDISRYQKYVIEILKKKI